MVKTLGLESWLQQTATGPYTIFVPTDDTFLTSGIDLASLIQSKPDVVGQIFKNHIITGQSLRQNDFKIGSTYTSMNPGQLLKLDSSLSPIMVEADIQACASMIHIVKKVLVPDFVNLSASASSTGSSSSTGSWFHGKNSQASSASSAKPASSASSASTAKPASSGTGIDATYVNVGGSSLTAVQANKNGGSLNVNAISISG